jgi:hypothetical protein
MTTYCHIAAGVVDNRALFDNGAGLPSNWPDRANWVADDTAQIGWAYDGQAFTAPPPPPDPIPTADQVLTGKIFANARRKAIITAIQTSDDVQLAALIAARYPTLSGDAIKAITDIFLTIAGYIRS